MSAWRVGSESAAMAERAEAVAFGPGEDGSVEPGQGAIDRLTKWIPGDALAFYVAAVTALAAGDKAEPSPVLLIVFIVLSAAFVIGGAFASSGEIPGSIVLPASLAAVAFTIWTLSVPFSGWHRWGFIDDHQAEVAIIAAVVGALFGFAADGFTKRAANREAQRRAEAP